MSYFAKIEPTPIKRVELHGARLVISFDMDIKQASERVFGNELLITMRLEDVIPFVLQLLRVTYGKK
jgi:hypothetical protein